MSKLPTAREMANALSQMGNPSIARKGVANDWYKRGELPPVGEVVECNDADGWQKCKILAVDSSGQLVVELFGDKKVECNHPNEVWTFRPIRTERDKLVELFSDDLRRTDVALTGSQQKIIAEHLIKSGYRKLKKQSEGQFIAYIGGIHYANWNELYRAGCRFIEQGSSYD